MKSGLRDLRTSNSRQLFENAKRKTDQSKEEKKRAASKNTGTCTPRMARRYDSKLRRKIAGRKKRDTQS